jgi:hypothetical protein
LTSIRDKTKVNQSDTSGERSNSSSASASSSDLDKYLMSIAKKEKENKILDPVHRGNAVNELKV